MSEKLTQEQIQEYIKLNQRRLVIRNTTAQEVVAEIVFTSKGGQEAKDSFKIGPNQFGRVPFFVDGICMVTIDSATQSIDMNEAQTEYELVIAYDHEIPFTEEAKEIIS